MMTLRFFSKILGSFLVGITCALLWVQHDERLLDFAHDRIVTVFKEQYSTRFCAESCKLNLFSLSLTFYNVHVEPFENPQEWSWAADSFTLKCSLLSYFYSKKIALTFYFDNVKAHTQISSSDISIMHHIQTIITAPSLEGPVDVVGVFLNDIEVHCNDKANEVVGSCLLSVAAEKSNNVFTTSIVVFEGFLKRLGTEYIQDLKGAVEITSKNASSSSVIIFDCSCISPRFPDDERYRCYVKGSWDGTVGSGIMHTKDHSLLVHPCSITKVGEQYVYSAKLSVDVDLVKRLALPMVKEKIEGVCECVIEGSTMGVVEGVFKASQIVCKGYTCDNITCSFKKECNDIHCVASIDFGEQSLEGLVDYSLVSKHGTYNLKNSSNITLYGYWELPEYDGYASGDFSFSGEQYLEYRATAHHKKTEEKVSINGTLVQKDGTMLIRGALSSQQYMIDIQTDPFIVKKALYTDKDGHELLQCLFTDASHFTAEMHYETVRSIARSLYDSFLPGQGLCTIKGALNEHGVVGTIDLSDALIRLPGMYNFIAHGSMNYTYDMQQNLFSCTDLLLFLHKGEIRSKRMTMRFSDENKKLFMYVPLNFYHCFFNLNKQLYGTLTGSLLYLHSNELAKLSGFCVVEEMNVNDNIFASGLSDSLSSGSNKKNDTPLYATQLAIDVSTHEPASIKTPVLETQAQCNCYIKNTLGEPLFDGVLRLQGGKITFPAHALDIKRGKITLVPYQNNDHLLDIVAQGRIKKYLVTLMIGGSLQDPTIMLQSSPSLTQEQIMMLLFGGTEEQSLNVMAPALVMYNAQNFLFSQSSQYETIKNSLVPSWFQPFQRVSFIPRFTDQTGRGGLKGVLEVEVNDRLRAAIEKNFSLSENASAEIEYLLSDDVSLKMSKDDRGDLGAELEMRFKF